jgi:hypothetical protein
VASLALFIALGGGAYAAMNLPKNSVGTAQLKKGAVSLDKIGRAAQESLRGVRGPAGPAGPPGAQGEEGPQGNANTRLVSQSPSTLMANSGIAFASIPLLNIGAAQLTIAIDADQITGGSGVLDCDGQLENGGVTRDFSFPDVTLPADPSAEMEINTLQLVTDRDDPQVDVFLSCDLGATPSSVQLTPRVGVVGLG